LGFHILQKMGGIYLGVDWALLVVDTKMAL
jgi:hypothetical protein